MERYVYGVFKCDYRSRDLEEVYSNKKDADEHVKLENTLLKSFCPYDGIFYQVGKLEIHDKFNKNEEQRIPKNVAVNVSYTDKVERFHGSVLELAPYNRWLYKPERKDMIRVLTKTIPSEVKYFRDEHWSNDIFFTIYIPYDVNKVYNDYCKEATELAKMYDDKYKNTIKAAIGFSPFGLLEELHFVPENLETSLAEQKIVKKLKAIKNHAYTGYTVFHRTMSLKDFADIGFLRSEVEDQRFYLEIEKG